MARRCDICGKGPLTGNRVSHSNRRVKTRTFPNLQKIRALYKGKSRQLTVCTRCIRSNAIQKTI